MSGIPIIPTLDTQQILQDPRDILSYQLRYYTTAPKSVSDTTPNEMISLMDDISKYQYNSGSLVNAVSNSLQTVYNRFFPPGATTVNVSPSDNGDGTYDIVIQISVILSGSIYSLGANVSVNTTGVLQLKWHPSLL